MKTTLRSGYTFAPQDRQIDFAGIAGFDPRGLLAVINKSAGEVVIYASGDSEAAITAVDGTVLTFAVNTEAMVNSDLLDIWYDDGLSIAGSASSVVTTDAGGTVAAGAVATAVAADPDRLFLELSNTGASPLSYRWGANPTATVGHPLAGGSTARFDARCPVGDLRVFSTAGTTFFVTAG